MTETSTFDPYAHDGDHWGVSLAQMTDLILPCLDAVETRTVAEVGAFAGDLTRVLVDWAESTGATVQAIDPSPQEGLVALTRASSQLELIRQTSLEALRELPIPDAVIIDGDHNYYTVDAELQLIAERSGSDRLPLLLFHDVCWPHGRRDDFFDVDGIPAAGRHATIGEQGGIIPGNPGVVPGGLPYPRSAAHEGGPKNGVLTAVEDFATADPRLRLAVVPAFFGLGAVWHKDAPGADELERILTPWDRNPILTRLEANRVRHLTERQLLRTELWQTQQRQAAQEALLHRLANSSAFGIAARLSALRVRFGVARWQAPLSREEIRRTLDA